MFSWSTSRKGPAARYPGQQSATAVPVAQVIQGTIRPPTNSYTRQQHIDSFRNDAVLKQSIRKVSADDTIYDTVFQTKDGVALILRISFPLLQHDSFPTRPPQMTLVGVKAMHDWLDSRMCIIGYPATQSDVAWQQSRLLLGTAVYEVVRHLQVNPPTVYEFTDPALAKLQPANGAAPSRIMPQNQQNLTKSQAQQPPDYNSLHYSMSPQTPVEMPAIPSQYPDVLDSLSREELQRLLSDESAFLAVVHDMPIYQEIHLQRTSLIEENTKKAMSVLEREQEYKMLHGQVKDLKESLVVKLMEFESLQTLQDELVKPPDVNQLKRELNRARKEAMDESETFAMEWVEDGSHVAEFCKKFVEQRNKMHLRAAKVELLEQQQQTMMRM
jgi:hypothetical protein